MKEYSKLVRKFECRTFTGLVLSFIANQISSHPIGKRGEKLTFYPCQRTGSIYFHLLHVLSISPWVPKYFQSCTTILGPSIALSVQADLQISFFHSHLQKDTLHVLGIILNVDSDVYELVEKYTHFSAFLYLTVSPACVKKNGLNLILNPTADLRPRDSHHCIKQGQTGASRSKIWSFFMK